MDSSAKNFQDFEPRFDWIHHPDSHVLIVQLLGFRSNQLKVQVTSTGKLRISGERKLGSGKWLRFQKETEIPADADADKISAKLEDGVLYVRQPKKPFASSNNPPAQPKAKPESQPPAAAVKPKVDPQPPAEAPKPAAVKPTADPPTIRQNAPKSRNDKSQAQTSGKQISPPQKPQVPARPKEEGGAPARSQKTAEKPSASAGQPVQEAAPNSKIEKQTDEKPKGHEKLKDALEETRQKEEKERIGSKMGEEGKEGGGSKMEEGKEKKRKGKGKGKEEEGGHGRGEKEGGVAEERRGKKGTVEMVDGGGRFRRGEGYKQVIDGMVKELRTNMVTLVLGVAVFVIVYLNLTKKGNVEEEL